MAPARWIVEFASGTAFLAAFDRELRSGSLTVAAAQPPGSELFDACEVEVRVSGAGAVVVNGWIATVIPGVGVGVVLGGVPAALAELAARLRSAPVAVAEMDSEAEAAAESDTEAATDAQKGGHSGLSSTEKMRLALSGTREERIALLRDLNKLLHIYVLRNPRIQLDEVQYAARLTGLSPDAMKFISDHPQWGLDSTTCGNLVRNPRTPLNIAIKLLDRIPAADLRTIARGAGRAPLVQAARRKLDL